MAKKKSTVNRPAPSFRMITSPSSLSSSERKKIFACNLDQLMTVTGLKRNEAAEKIGISYRLVRRLVSAGVSRLDGRNEESIQKIVDFFGLTEPDDLWQADLLSWLLNPEYGTKFIDRFQGDIDRVKKKHSARSEKVKAPLMKMIDRALGAEPPQTDHLAMCESILASPKSETFKSLIEDYNEFVNETRPETRRATG